MNYLAKSPYSDISHCKGKKNEAYEEYEMEEFLEHLVDKKHENKIKEYCGHNYW